MRIVRRFRAAGALVSAAMLAAAIVLALTPLVAAAAAQPSGPIGPLPTAGRPDVRDDEVLVKFRPGTPAASQAAAHRQAGGQVAREVRALDVKVVKVPPGQAARRLQVYQQNPTVEYAELNGIAYAAWTPNDSYFSDLWGLHNTGQAGGRADADVDAPRAWDVTRGAPGVRIAILDSGVRKDHPDLVRPGTSSTSKVVLERDWVVDSPRDKVDPNDHYGHGTHVAGTAAAVTNNGAGIAGVCAECELINGKVLADDGGGAYDWIASGVLWAAGCEYRYPSDVPLLQQTCVDASGKPAQPLARVLNLSLGGYYDSQTLRDAVTLAWQQGTLLACAAGNDGRRTPFYPAAYEPCIGVAATDRHDRKASWSNASNRWVSVAAPGVDILSALPQNDALYTSASGYAWWSGTSMATPHVAGLAGLLWANGLSRNSDVRQAIESTADKISGTGRDWVHGRVNACKAVGGSLC